MAAWVVMEDGEGNTWVASVEPEPDGEGWDGRPADEMSNFGSYARAVTGPPDPARYAIG